MHRSSTVYNPKQFGIIVMFLSAVWSWHSFTVMLMQCYISSYLYWLTSNTLISPEIWKRDLRAITSSSGHPALLLKVMSFLRSECPVLSILATLYSSRINFLLLVTGKTALPHFCSSFENIKLIAPEVTLSGQTTNLSRWKPIPRIWSLSGHISSALESDRSRCLLLDPSRTRFLPK